MMFLIRTAFWLSIVVMLLPTPSSEQNTNQPQVGALQAMSAASATVSDMRQFCARQPDVCDVGSQALSQFGHKAQASAKWLYEFLGEKLGPRPTGAVAGADAATPAQSEATPPSQNTLTPTDVGPAWRSPPPRREAEIKRPL